MLETKTVTNVTPIRRGRAVLCTPPSPKFSCKKVSDERINDVSVKALLPGRGDFLPLARVGSWSLACSVLAFVSCKKSELAHEARATGLTTADFLQIATGGSNHGGQRQTKD